MVPIGDIARRAGLQTSALRYYEKCGLLPRPERVSGQRRYPPAILDRLRVIRFARDTGFSIREIRQLFAGRRYSTAMRTLARGKLAELEAQIRRARAMRSLLVEALRCDCLTAEECGRRIRRADARRPAIK